ncbi:MAG: iron-containing alcohol dehydrogenase, partial [Desulfobacteraceae bacterium]
GAVKTHGPVWALNHRSEAKGNAVDCAACHEQDYCLECHKSGFADEQGSFSNNMINVHSSDFHVTHPLSARTDLEHGVKVSMRSEMMYPDVALVDPCLTRFMPGDVTAFTGMDALTQLIEAFVSRFSNPYTDALCREGIARSARSLSSAVGNGQDLNAREDLSLAALFSGIALANAKLGAVHGIAGPMGGMISAPHGLICAVLLAPVMAENVRQLEKRTSPDSSAALAKFGEVAGILTGNSRAGIEQGAGWIRGLVAEMDLPSLSQFGLEPAVCRAVSRKALQASSMKGNPVDLDEKGITSLLETVS